MIIFELFVWGFSIIIAAGLILGMFAELLDVVDTPNNDAEFLIKEKIWQKDFKTTDTFDKKFSIEDPLNFSD
tara:strand:- start:1143 stop:1358 length:216 start_codon:yes stop_codon:yes gene_type:complete